jgi:hypothetical protein
MKGEGRALHHALNPALNYLEKSQNPVESGIGGNP